MACTRVVPTLSRVGRWVGAGADWIVVPDVGRTQSCFLHTSDAADDQLCVDLVGRRTSKLNKAPHLHVSPRCAAFLSCSQPYT